MPMGIVSDSDLEKELSLNEAKPLVIPILDKGRATGDNNVPEYLRNVIAQDAIENGRQSAIKLAADFGISPSSVSAYTKGATSTASYHESNTELKNHITGVKNKIAGKARRRLNYALNEITPERLAGAKLETVAGVARDMAVIVKQMEPPPESETQRNTNVQVVLFAPKTLTDEDFPSILVKE